jgi:ubiquinone/menaquinone biosynthesis C-methylase UbiE
MPWKTRYGSLAVRIYRALVDPLLRSLRPKIVRICRELGARNVLDIATATGAQCRALGRAGIHATGLDLAEAMIAAAQRRGGANTQYVRGSAYELPFPDGSFDASLLLLALHEHPEDERLLMIREAIRVLRPGGALILADYAKPTHLRLHIPWQLIRLIESVAGPEHSAGFRDFVTHGCLNGLIERRGLAPAREGSSHFGTIGIAVFRQAVASITDIES